MQTIPANIAKEETNHRDALEEAQHERWAHWPVNWSAVWVGALAGVAAVLLCGLIGLAVGAPLLSPEHRVVDLKKLGLGALAFSVFSAFLSFVIAGWVAGKIAGILHAEPAMLHGAIAWLVAIPIVVVLIGLGAGNLFGGWYAGLRGAPAWTKASEAPFDRPESLDPGATEQERSRFKAELDNYRQEVREWRENMPKVSRNSALGAVTALLLGLVGGVLGGWMASGEPMTLTQRKWVETLTARTEQVRVRI